MHDILNDLLTATSIVANIFAIYKVFKVSKQVSQQGEIINNLQLQVHHEEKTNIQTSDITKINKIIYNGPHNGKYCTWKAFNQLSSYVAHLSNEFFPIREKLFRDRQVEKTKDNK